MTGPPPPTRQSFLVDRWSTAWQGVLRPWLEQATADSLTAPGPVSLAAPSFAHLARIRLALAEDGVGIGGVRLWTPGMLRGHLLSVAGIAREPAIGEDLQLLAQSAASRHDDLPQARSVVADPRPFLRAADRMHASGRSAGELPGPAWSRIGLTYEEELQRAGYASSGQIDRQLQAAAADLPQPLLAGLCVWGFSDTDWNLWPLLSAAFRLARRATVILEYRGETAAALSWLAAWESIAGEPEPLEGSIPGDATPPPVRFFLSRDLPGEAECLVAEAGRALLRDARHVGIVVPAGSALAREVALRLDEHRLPHHDAHGYHPPAPEPVKVLTAWIAWQQAGRVAEWIELLRALARCGEVDRAEARRLEADLAQSLRKTVCDDFAVVAAWMRQNRPGRYALLDRGETRRLPETATPGEFVAATATAVRTIPHQLEWNELWERARTVAGRLTTPISRDAFLRWLESTMVYPGRVRMPQGRHALARIQLIPDHVAQGFGFDYIVIGGLNEGSWPRPEPPDAPLPEGAIQRFNDAILDEEQRERGDFAIDSPFSWIPTSGEKRRAVAEQLEALARNAPALSVSASLEDPEDPGVHRGLHETYLAWMVARGRNPPDPRALEAFARESGRQLDPVEPSPAAQGDRRSPHARRAVDAWRRRRDPDAPASEYDFGFSGDRPHPPLRLPARAWEQFLRSPGAAWLQQVARIAPIPDFRESPAWALLRGIFVHEWLSASLDTPGDTPGGTRLPDENTLREIAETTRRRMTAAYAGARRALPDWWDSGWEENLAVAVNLLQKLRHAIAAWDWRWTEVDLAAGPADNPGGLPIHGRADLILARPAEGSRPRGVPSIDSPDKEGWEFWVIDFKTGRQAALDAKRIARGDGLQVSLYAVALQGLTGRNTLASVLSPASPELQPQIESNALVHELAEFWKALSRVAYRGQLGFCEPLRQRYGAAGVYPSAMTPIPRDILTAKWAQTHPDIPSPRFANR